MAGPDIGRLPAPLGDATRRGIIERRRGPEHDPEMTTRGKQSPRSGHSPLPRNRCAT